ncbi:hypothetical protein LINPERPRIM_LOCUS16815, partial [Linum perenne]
QSSFHCCDRRFDEVPPLKSNFVLVFGICFVFSFDLCCLDRFRSFLTCSSRFWGILKFHVIESLISA